LALEELVLVELAKQISSLVVITIEKCPWWVSAGGRSVSD